MTSREQPDDLRIEPARAKALLDGGEAVVLDVVASHVWPQMHRAVRGAIRIPPEEVAGHVDELPRDRTLITYCTWPQEYTSARVALFLRNEGFRAYAIRGGFMGWRDAGYPLEPKAVEVMASIDDVCAECGRPMSEHLPHGERAA